MTRAVELAQVASNGVSEAFKNRIINGAMVIDQRNAGASVTVTGTNAVLYYLDRWYARTNSATGSRISVQRSTVAPAGFTNSALITSLSAYSLGATEHFGTNQAIEGLNVADLGWGTSSAKTITVSFWVRSSLTGTFGGHIANDAGNRCFVFSYTINAANTWEYKTVTVIGDTTGTWVTDNGVGVFLSFSVGAGSSLTTTAGSWSSTFNRSVTGQTSLVGTNGATFYITGVQLEVGSTATSFDYRPYGTELALCQRYYETSYPQGTTVPTNSRAGYAVCAIGSTTYFGGATGDVSQNLNTVFFKVPKRTTATITTYSYVSSTTSMAGNGWTGADLAANTAVPSSYDQNGFNIYNGSGANRTVNSGAVMFHFAASAEL